MTKRVKLPIAAAGLRRKRDRDLCFRFIRQKEENLHARDTGKVSNEGFWWLDSFLSMKFLEVKHRKV
jgi:hypothetical protein